MNIFTIDTYQDNVKNINEKEIEYIIFLKYSEEDIECNFNENEPLFENKYFCSKVDWNDIVSYHNNKLSFDFLRKHKKHIFYRSRANFNHFTEEFLDEMWDEFEDNDNFLKTLISIKNLSIEFIERRFEDIIEKNICYEKEKKQFDYSYLWHNIYYNLKNIDKIKNLLLKKIFINYAKKEKPLYYLDYLELINSN